MMLGLGDETRIPVPSGSYDADYSTGCPTTPACKPWQHIVGSPIPGDAQTRNGVCRCALNWWFVGGVAAVGALLFMGGRR